MKELTGHNGAKIVINSAPFKVVKQLRKCIAQELKELQIDIGNPDSLLALKKEFGNNVSKYLNSLKNLLLGLETSEEFERVVWLCLQECLYDQKAITPTLFDDIERAREDYDLIVYECVKENLGPFFKSLGGMFATPNLLTEEILQSESQPTPATP